MAGGKDNNNNNNEKDEDRWNDRSSNSLSISSEDDEAVEETQSSREQPVVTNPLVDQLIVRLMTAKQHKSRQGSRRIPSTTQVPLSTVPVRLSYEELVKLCDLACESFKKQKSLITLGKKDLPIVVCSDIHGQFQDLREIFVKCGSPHQQNYLFLGDYVDRGSQGIPTLALLLALKIRYPNKVFLLRGNHEDIMTTLSYGFYDECLACFANSTGNLGELIYRKFLDVFGWIPFAGIIDKAILCVHGGLSPSLDSLESIEKISRPCIIPPYGLACDLVWSDPNDPNDAERKGWSMSVRGISFSYSQSEVEECCNRLGIDLIVRGHQLLRNMFKNGYAFSLGGRLLTLFSARNYTNLGNSAAVLRINEDLKCSFVVFRMKRKKSRRWLLFHTDDDTSV